MLPEPTYPGPLPAGARAALALPAPGSGGWYWPIGTEDFNGWSGWLDPRGAYVHVAQDMPCAYGRAVYAVGDGVVFISRADAGGYGVGGLPAAASSSRTPRPRGQGSTRCTGTSTGCASRRGGRAGREGVGTSTAAGTCTSARIPGTRYRDGNPYAGHVPKSWADHGGYVDPVKFLKTNPRAAAYKPPELPWADVVTASAPLQYGAAGGAAYWTEEGGAESLTWRLDLASGERTTLAASEVVPPFDTRRYETRVLAAPAVGFTVADHQPVVTLKAKHDTPAWGADALLAATLTSTAGAPLQGGILKLQRFHSGRWQVVQLAVTDALGTATFLYQTPGSISLRAVFAPPVSQPAARTYLAARSRTEIVTPHVALTTPRVPAVVDAADLVTVTGDLTPHHAAGEHTVVLLFQRRGEGGDWVTKLTVAAVNRDLDDGAATRYVGHARLTAGSWRVQATHPADEAHALSATSWRTFAVE